MTSTYQPSHFHLFIFAFPFLLPFPLRPQKKISVIWRTSSNPVDFILTCFRLSWVIRSYALWTVLRISNFVVFGIAMRTKSNKQAFFLDGRRSVGNYSFFVAFMTKSWKRRSPMNFSVVVQSQGFASELRRATSGVHTIVRSVYRPRRTSGMRLNRIGLRVFSWFWRSDVSLFRGLYVDRWG